MKNNINPFVGDKIYQMTKTLVFRNHKSEEAYMQDQYLRNKFPLILLSIFSILLMIYSYFSNSCNSPISVDCNHNFLFILNLLGYFFSSYAFSLKKMRYKRALLLFFFCGIYGYIKLLEEFEPRVGLVLIGIHLTIISFFSIYHWKLVVFYEISIWIATLTYMKYFGDFFLLENIEENKGFLMMTILTSVFLISLCEKINKEKWVLFDSYKKSEKLLEFLIESLSYPVFLLDEHKKVILRNKAAQNIFEENSLPLFLPSPSKNFFSLFPNEISQNKANDLIDSVLFGGNNNKKGLFMVSCCKQDDELELKEKDYNSTNTKLYSIVVEGFIWKGLRCILVEFKEETAMETISIYNKVLCEEGIAEKVSNMLASQYVEEGFFYDSLLQNTDLMESRKKSLRKLFKCYKYTFTLSLVQNFLDNDLKKIELINNRSYSKDFLPQEILGVIIQVNSDKCIKNEITLEITSFDSDKSSLNYSENLSNEKHFPLLKCKSSNSGQDNQFLYGPCFLYQYAIIVLLRAVIKEKICKRITLAHKIDGLLGEDNNCLLILNLEFEEPVQKNEFSFPPNNQNMLIGDILSNTFKEKKKLHNFLSNLMKVDPVLNEYNAFYYLKEQNPKKISKLLLPHIFMAMETKYEIISDDEFGKRSTKLQIKFPMKKSNSDLLLTNTKKSCFFQEKKEDIEESKNNFNFSPPLKKASLSFKQQVFSYEFFGPKIYKESSSHVNEEKKQEETNAFERITRANSQEFPKEMVNKISAGNRKKSPFKTLPTVKKTEVFIEEELKKYLYHLQNGFTTTIENILNDILNNDSYNEAKIIFPAKKQFLEDKKQHKVEKNYGRATSISTSNKIHVKNQKFNIDPYQEKDEKDEVSSVFFTESNITESALTGKSNDEDNLDYNLSSNSNREINDLKRTRSNQLKPRSLINHEKSYFKSPNLLLVVPEEKHVLRPSESLLKYLKPSLKASSFVEKEENKAKDLHQNVPSKHKLEIPTLAALEKPLPKPFKDKKKTTNPRSLTYVRRWYLYKGATKTELNCSLTSVNTKQNIESSEFPKKEDDNRKYFVRKPIKKPNSIVSDTKIKTKELMKKKNQDVLKNIKLFEEVKQDDDILVKKSNIEEKYGPIFSNLSYKENPTILAFDSESSFHIKDPLRCKGVKALALKVGHDYKFELCKTGIDIIKNYKSFIKKSLIYHIILIELDMPGMEAWKCVKKIRNFEAKYKPKIRSFICALLTEEQLDFELYVRWGIDEFLRKPFNQELFEGILKRVIDGIKKNNTEKLQTQIEVVKNLEYEGVKSGFSGILEDAKQAQFQNEPLLMLTIDDNNFILMGMCHLRSKVNFFFLIIHYIRLNIKWK